MYFLIYSSFAAIEFDDDQLKSLLVQAREKNLRLGITGMLYYFKKQFMQLIEGDEAVIKQMTETISQDSRHSNFLVLKEGKADERFFADWSMGFKSIDPENFKEVNNFKDLNTKNALDTAPFLHLFKILATN